MRRGDRGQARAVAGPRPGRAPGRAGERGYTLYEIMIVTTIIALVASFAIPSMLDARRVANEASALATLRTLFEAQQTYARKAVSPVPGVPYALSATAVESAGLLPAGLIDADMDGAYTRGGYNFVTGFLNTSNNMYVAATPEVFGKSGMVSYLVLDDGVYLQRRGPFFLDADLGAPVGK